MAKKMTMMVAVLALLLTASFAGAANVSYSGGTYTQNFNTLASSGGGITWTNDSTLTGWYAYEDISAPYTTYDAQDGSVNTEHIFSLGENGSSDRAFGGRQYKEYFAFGLGVVNNTGGDLNQITINATGEQWRSYGTHEKLFFEYSLSASSPDPATSGWTAVTDLDFGQMNTTSVGAIDGNLAQNQAALSATINLSSAWANGNTLYIRWTQGDESSQGDYLAVDDFSFSAAVPEPATMGMLAVGGLGVLLKRRKK